MSEKRQDKPFGIEEAKNVYAEGLAAGMRMGARQMQERCIRAVEHIPHPLTPFETFDRADVVAVLRALPEET